MKKEINKSLSVKFIDYEVQNGYPSEYKIRKWARRAYLGHNKNSVNIKLASVSEMKSLNKKYFNTLLYAVFLLTFYFSLSLMLLEVVLQESLLLWQYLRLISLQDLY